MSRRRLICWTLLLAGAVVLAHGLWIPAKAALAQKLLERAWERAQKGEEHPRPWPWADTWPLARLEAPRQNQHQIVLAGASGATLAFGPGHLDGTAMPGQDGNIVISGHRDTHFRFLKDLEIGDELRLETMTGKGRSYRVVSLEVVDEHDLSVLERGEEAALTLLTCYPFDAVVPGGSLRFVVRALEGRSTG